MSRRCRRGRQTGRRAPFCGACRTRGGAEPACTPGPGPLRWRDGGAQLISGGAVVFAANFRNHPFARRRHECWPPAVLGALRCAQASQKPPSPMTETGCPEDGRLTLTAAGVLGSPLGRSVWSLYLHPRQYMPKGASLPTIHAPAARTAARMGATRRRSRGGAASACSEAGGGAPRRACFRPAATCSVRAVWTAPVAPCAMTGGGGHVGRVIWCQESAGEPAGGV